MSRELIVKCERCGKTRDQKRPPATEEQHTWWLLEDQGERMRTGPLDFCSLTCLVLWTEHPEVRRFYAADFATGVAS